MADVIEFPASDEPEALPQPGDAYRAFAEASRELVCLAVVFADGSMDFFQYGWLKALKFTPSGGDGGTGVIAAIFESVPGYADGLRVSGRDLLHAAALLDERRLRWIWEVPKGGKAEADASPVVRTIEIREDDARTIYAWLFQGGGH
jgi:hypothetical protein